MDFFINQINEEKTVKKAKKFLEEDFRTLINYSGIPISDLSSPLLDPAGVAGGSNVNHADDQFLHNIKHMTVVKRCEYAVDAVIETINSCANTEREPYRKILFRKYVKNDFDLWIYQDLNISKSKFDRLKNRAVLEFAQKAERYRQKYQEYGIGGLFPEMIVFNT